MLFPTSLVGSYPQPGWLIDRARLADRFPPRVRARELWRIDPGYLEQAQDDATLLAIRAQEQAGLDILTDGEERRESYSNRFATALDGVDIDNPGTALDRSGHPNPVPRVTGPIRRRHPVEVEDLKFLRANTSRTVKITVPGPFTMSQQAQDDHYGNPESLALGYAEAVGEEVRDLFAAGADIVQLDEPYLQARPEPARQFGVKVINRALEEAAGTTAVHLCFGYAAIIHDRPAGYSFLPELAACRADQISIETAQSGLDCSVLATLDGKTIILGVLDLNDMTVESADTVVDRVERALPYVPAERVVLAPDCGMKYLPRDIAFGKLTAMTEAAGRLRAGQGSLPETVPSGRPGRAQYCRDLWAGRGGVPAVWQRRSSAFGGRARGDGPGPARAVRAGVPGAAARIPATAGIPATARIPAAAGIRAAAGVWAAASVTGFSLAVVVGVPLGPAVGRFPRAAAPAAPAAGLFGLGAAAGIHRPAASQPVVERQPDEQLAEQQ